MYSASVVELVDTPDSKSGGFGRVGSIPTRGTTNFIDAGIAQLARASAFQAEGREFESRFPLHYILSTFFRYNHKNF